MIQKLKINGVVNLKNKNFRRIPPNLTGLWIIRHTKTFMSSIIFLNSILKFKKKI